MPDRTDLSDMIVPGTPAVNMVDFFIYSPKFTQVGKHLLTNNIGHTADRETV